MIIVLVALGGWLVVSPAAALVVGLVLRKASQGEQDLDGVAAAPFPPVGRVLVRPAGS